MGTADIEVANGVTMGDIRYAAATAVHACRTTGSNNVDRYEIAWSAVAELVWTAEEPPSRGDMVRAGVTAIDRWVTREYHFEGKREGRRSELMRAAVLYWWEYSLPTPSPENPVVESLALRQILATLTPGQRDAILAMATHGAYAEAADMLGVTVTTFYQRIATARGKFLTLWHEGESPTATWRRTRRSSGEHGKRALRAAVTSRARKRALPPHGTPSRYGRHGCRCVPCTTAYSERMKGYQRKKGVPPKRRHPVTATQLAEIRNAREAGYSMNWLANRYHTSTRTLGRLLRGEVAPAPGGGGVPRVGLEPTLSAG